MIISHANCSKFYETEAYEYYICMESLIGVRVSMYSFNKTKGHPGK